MGEAAQITVTVLHRGPPRFNMVGQRLPDNLRDTDQTISPGLVARLHRYGLAAMHDAGFNVDGWRCEVYTMDGDLRPSERYYCVEFVNVKGGRIGLKGILTGHGHPALDHGFSIGVDG